MDALSIVILIVEVLLCFASIGVAGFFAFGAFWRANRETRELKQKTEARKMMGDFSHPFDNFDPFAAQSNTNPNPNFTSGAITQIKSVYVSFRFNETKTFSSRLYDLLDKSSQYHVTAHPFIANQGSNYVSSIRSAVQSSEIVLVVLSKQWSTVTNSQGRPMIQDPQDIMHAEISTALTSHKRIIVVLANHHFQPTPTHLPSSLQALVSQPMVSIYDDKFEAGLNELASMM